MKNRLANYLRTRRKRAGLSQRELGLILGYRNESTVSTHENSRFIPPFLIALAYEVIFQEPVSEIFAGLREGVEGTIERRITEFETNLLKLEQQGKGKRPTEITRKLEWIRGRHPLHP